MRTRLRTRLHREDEPILKAPVSAAQPAALPPQSGMVHLQRTLGNASLRRMLQSDAGARHAPGLIQRDAARDKPGAADAAPGAPQYMVFLTINDSRGKPVRGGSKRKDHEGQFELENLSLGSAERKGARGRTSGDKRQTEHSEQGDVTTVTTDEPSDLMFVKHLDDASPVLMQMVADGHRANLRFDLVRIDETGREHNYMTVEVKDAIFTGIQVSGQASDKDKTPLEVISVEAPGMTTTMRTLAEKAPGAP